MSGIAVELLDGRISDMSPQSGRHAVAVFHAQRTLADVFSTGYHVRVQMPLALSQNSEPEPDVAVAEGEDPRRYLPSHPSHAVLIVEVADSSLCQDRELKAGLYARAGIPEYWLINLVDDSLVVYRDPMDGAYRSLALLRPGDTLCPLNRPDSVLAVSQLLP